MKKLLIMPYLFLAFFYVTYASSDEFETLSRAVKQNDISTIQSALNNGINLSQVRGLNQEGLLHISANENNIHMMKLLLDRGFRVDDTDRAGLTPLYFAAKSGHISAMSYLLQSGAGIDGEIQGPEAIELHKKKLELELHIEELEFKLAQNFSNLEELPYEAYLLNLKTEEDLVKWKKDLSDVEYYLNKPCPLYGAVFGVSIESVEFLLKSGANVDYQDIWHERKTALHLASQIGNLDIVKLLTDYGANENVLDANELTPLQTAEKFGSNEVANYLKLSAKERARLNTCHCQNCTIMTVSLEYDNQMLNHKIMKLAPRDKINTLISIGMNPERYEEFLKTIELFGEEAALQTIENSSLTMHPFRQTLSPRIIISPKVISQARYAQKTGRIYPSLMGFLK